MATEDQAEQIFKRFFPVERYAIDAENLEAEPNSRSKTEYQTSHIGVYGERKCTEVELNELAKRFAEIVPPGTYSVAQLQGYLLTKKFDPFAAIEWLPAWLQNQEEEKAAIEGMRQRRREDAARRRQEARDMEDQWRADELARMRQSNIGKEETPAPHDTVPVEES